MDYSVPKRLNLAIGNSCYVNCPGCYQVFGNERPQLEKILQSVARFTDLGIRRITISGGDPLLIKDLLSFLRALRALNIEEIKLDTVGLGLIHSNPDQEVRQLNIEKTQKLHQLLSTLGLPLDGWDTQSLQKFRTGRKELFDDLLFLLNSLSDIVSPKWVVINTVAHAHNIENLEKIHAILDTMNIIKEWHIFQYTPTDQVGKKINDNYTVTDEIFSAAKAAFLAQATNQSANFSTHFYSNEDRLGWYLLINSDGNAWLPDRNGKTVNLGTIFGREEEVLHRWSEERIRCKLVATS